MSLATTLLAFRVTCIVTTSRSQNVLPTTRRKQFNPSKARRGAISNVHRATARSIRPAQSAQNAHRATARATRLAQSAQRVHFAISKCEPRRSESDSTRPKRAKGSLCDLKMCTAPQRERFNPPKVRRGFTLQSPNAHHAASRATRPLKVLRLPRNLHASWKVLRLPRNLHE